jgi:hypothetical protein
MRVKTRVEEVKTGKNVGGVFIVTPTGWRTFLFMTIGAKMEVAD